MHLGELNDATSFVSRAVREIDKKYGKNPFYKADLMRDLPKEIVRNKQPLRAITAYLCYTNHLVEIANNKFQRTSKRHEYDSFDEARKLHSSPPAKIETRGGQYYYTEEEGLYPDLN